MKRKLITISDSGNVTVPSKTKMSISEIADLFGIYYQTAKRHIRAIEKSGVVNGDCSMSSAYDGSKVYPDYYGAYMIIAVAFRVQSEKTEMFRRWVVRRVTKSDIQIVLTSLNNKAMMN